MRHSIRDSKTQLGTRTYHVAQDAIRHHKKCAWDIINTTDTMKQQWWATMIRHYKTPWSTICHTIRHHETVYMSHIIRHHITQHEISWDTMIHTIRHAFIERALHKAPIFLLSVCRRHYLMAATTKLFVCVSFECFMSAYVVRWCALSAWETGERMGGHGPLIRPPHPGSASGIQERPGNKATAWVY